MSLAAGSFRDPSGQVFLRDGRVFRTINRAFADRHRAFRSSPLYRTLVDEGRILPGEPVPRAEVPEADGDVAEIVEQPRIPFISYPYEWAFGQLRDAALAHLEIQQRALAAGFALRDATPFNMQFLRGRLVHIDLLSFEPYIAGTFWTAYRQFCEQFLNPLLLTSCAGVSFQPYLRGRLDGLPATELSRLLPWRARLRPAVLKHVVVFARVQRTAAADDTTMDARDARDAAAVFNKEAYGRLLAGLEKLIRSLSFPAARFDRVWSEYAGDNSYDTAAADAKAQFIRDAVAAEQPGMLWDLGGNTGHYSRVALDAGAAHAVMFDGDAAAVEKAYQERPPAPRDLLPLVVDFMNPTPAAGWRLRERESLQARGPADMFLALALVHHLCISHNLPLDEVAAWLAETGRAGVVEFVPKDDPMTARLLRHREDIFPGYTQPAFEAALARHFEIVARTALPRSTRTLYRVRRRAA